MSGTRGFAGFAFFLRGSSLFVDEIGSENVECSKTNSSGQLPTSQHQHELIERK